MTKELGRRQFIWLTLPHIVHCRKTSRQEPKQGRNLEAKADAEAIEECHLLTFLGFFLIEPRATSPGMQPQ